MKLKRSIFSFVTVLASLAATGAASASISKPCAFLLRLTQHALGRAPEDIVALEPTQAFDVPDVPYMPHYGNANLVFTAGNVELLARRLAAGMLLDDAGPIEAHLREALRAGRTVSLSEVLPSRIAEILGTFACNENFFCYRTAFNFHEDIPLEHGTAAGPQIIHYGEYMNTKYRNVVRGERLRFGDMVAFYKRLPPENHVQVFHVAIYLGGDLVFHKMGPNMGLPYEITTVDALVKRYELCSSLQVNQIPGIVDWPHQIQLSIQRPIAAP